MALVLALMFPHGVVGSQVEEVGVPSDVKYIRCHTCEHLVTALHEQMKAPDKRPDESAVQLKIEKACKHGEAEGAWLRSLDMVENEETIRLEKQPQDGPCGKECLTIALACQRLLEEGWENELGEALWEGSMSAQELSVIACKKWSSACRRAPPKVDASRPKGPQFRPYSDTEREALEGDTGRAGLLSWAELRQSLGLSPEEEAHSDDELGADLATQQARLKLEQRLHQSEVFLSTHL